MRALSDLLTPLRVQVTRDRLMLAADTTWPVYGFAQHKGYPTRNHMSSVRKHGPCPIHRLTFRPLPEIVAALSEPQAGAGAAGASEGNENLV